MTREARRFQAALVASLLLHVLVVALFMILPGGGPAEPVQIYTVRIMEAPARPEARALSLSTDVISALKLESPTLSVDAPPPPEAESADVPAVERFPAPEAPASALPPSPMPARPALRPSVTPPAPSGPPARPELQPPAAAPSGQALPQLPSLPAAAPPVPPRVGAPPPEAPRSSANVLAPPPPPPVADEPVRQSAMERLRSKVQTLNLEVEAAPPPGPAARPSPSRERNVLSLRMYSNRVREAIKEQYTFPGGFPASLRTRVRVVLNRDGSVRSTQILESSGNERFDRLVCLAAFTKARIPAIPEGIDSEGDTLTLYFTCSP